MKARKKLGPLENVMGMLPGGDQMMKNADMEKGKKELSRMEAIICGMTLGERRNPNVLNASRRKRVARGSGVSVAEVNTMLNKFYEMQKMMKKMGKLQKMMARMGGGPMSKMMGGG